ncbi:NADPH:quinone reductase-like Zn-dependent oxidoreductase [Streptomyces sp. BK022]|uniref:NADP-dependent oxidoreductase n=1 Tax=Streptomyces sp. BK022 TaxID=2512123 RepID=UPI00102A247D|nr:NADP-dependent oxidoreductase [Streptomyces sp. BK022]RZU37833.1 NADPH:quinone reductase-like Zn-dependent oxidoreductase [Streptomyces sp. BK022]
MKAVTVAAFGEPPQVSEQPEPKVGPDTVLVRVKVAGVNPVDWKVAAGRLDSILYVYLPLIPGWDVAGVVEKVGAAVTEYAPGDEVIAYDRMDTVQHGAYAELVPVPVRSLARKPASLSWQQAGGLPLAGLAAYQSLQAADVAKGDTVLVNNAAGGVGSFAVQIAVATGARVIGTAGEAKAGYLRSLGAEPVAYGEGLVQRVRALAPEGVDAALDFYGGEAISASMELTKSPSRVVSLVDPAIRELGGRYVFVRPDHAGLAELGSLSDAGKLTVHVEQELPLTDVAEAWQLSQSGHTTGKIVLRVS